jgi:hypothetical protein
MKSRQDFDNEFNWQEYLRQYYAGLAMQAARVSTPGLPSEILAGQAVLDADALIANSIKIKINDMNQVDKDQLEMAEFMGFTFIPAGTLSGQPNDSWNIKSNVPVYLSNWDRPHFKDDFAWLYPVMMKIERVAMQAGVVSGLRHIELSKNTFEDCMKFIKWYNTQ